MPDRFRIARASDIAGVLPPLDEFKNPLGRPNIQIHE
jgi:hypothetical protein